MTDSALVKLKRASKRIEELNAFLASERPFSYVLRTDTVTGERSTRAEKNEAVADEAAAVAGDAVHNIRSSLDHAYWEIVHPFATNRREENAIQFPFSQEAARLEEAVKNRLAARVSDKFFRTIMTLRPHGEATGNRMLYLIHLLDIPDKHRYLTPTADYKRITLPMIRRQVPDFPEFGGTMTFGGNRRGDARWQSRNIDPATLGGIVAPTLNVFEKKLDVPVEIVFAIRELDMLAPMVPTLNKLIEVARDTINTMRLAAP